MKLITTAVLGLVLSASAFSDELLVSAAKAKSSEALAFDYVSEGSAVAFDFKVKVDATDASQIDLSKCVAGLPKSHTGQCSFAKGMVIVMVYNDTNEALPKGVLNIGSVSVRGGSASSVVSFTAVDKSANNVKSSVRADSLTQTK
jgi:hypothetical protein